MRIRIQVIGNDGNTYSGEVDLQPDKKSQRKVRETKISEPDGKQSCPAALKFMWQASEFSSPLGRQVVEEKLAKRGFHFDSSTVHIALDKSTFLTRLGKKGNFTWVQKYPSSSGKTD